MLPFLGSYTLSSRTSPPGGFTCRMLCHSLALLGWLASHPPCTSAYHALESGRSLSPLVCSSQQPDDVLSVVTALLDERGRCSLAQVGEHLRLMGIRLPERQSLGEFVLAHPQTLSLSGPRNSRKVSLVGRCTEDAMVVNVVQILRAHGPMTTVELKLRLSEHGRYVPALGALLRRRNETFVIEKRSVWLRDDATTTADALSISSPAPITAARPLVRLLSLELSSAMDRALVEHAAVATQVVAIDMDNKAFLLERVTKYAVEAPGVLVLAFCSRTHNPRLSAAGAELVAQLASIGRLRLVMPERDTKNAADFVMSFWMGWLHAQVPAAANFDLVSTDIHLERTVADSLRREGRSVTVSESAASDAFAWCNL